MEGYASTQNIQGGLHQAGGASFVGNTLTGSVTLAAPPPPPIQDQRPTPSSTVPFPIDHGFVDRSEILSDITTRCSTPGAGVALVGFGGVGKSQLAIQYSRKVREESPETWVFWVHAGSPAKFEEDYRDIAERVKIPGRNDTKDIVPSVYRWLSDLTNGKWFMILDGADSAEGFFRERHTVQDRDSHCHTSAADENSNRLGKYIARTGNGTILVTSRDENTASKFAGNDINIIKVQPMSDIQSLELLKNRLRPSVRFMDADAAALVRELEFMPLPISQAAAYINQRNGRVSVKKYIEILRENEQTRSKLLGRDCTDPHRDDEQNNSIINTWHISFQQIRTQRRSAADLLSLMSLFDNQGIPEKLLREDMQKLDCTDSVHSFNDDFEEDLGVLRNYSLIDMYSEGAHFEMHRLVQLSTRNWLEINGELEKWRVKYVELLHDAFPCDPLQHWYASQTLYSHGRTLLLHRPSAPYVQHKWMDTVFRLVTLATLKGDILEAEKIVNVLLDESEGRPIRAVFYKLLSFIWCHGEKTTAAALFPKALEGSLDESGNETNESLQILNYWAEFYRRRNTYDEAKKLQTRALEVGERLYGEGHEETLTCACDLANMLEATGEKDEALKLRLRVVNATEEIAKTDDVDTYFSIRPAMIVRIKVLQTLGRYDEAIDKIRMDLSVLKQSFGEYHKYTLESLLMLAETLKDQNKIEESIAAFRDLVSKQEYTLGKLHLETLFSLLEIAQLLNRQRNFEEAERTSELAVTGFSKEMGDEGMFTIAANMQLAVSLIGQERHLDALKLLDLVSEPLKKVSASLDPGFGYRVEVLRKHCEIRIIGRGKHEVNQ